MESSSKWQPVAPPQLSASFVRLNSRTAAELGQNWVISNHFFFFFMGTLHHATGRYYKDNDARPLKHPFRLFIHSNHCSLDFYFLFFCIFPFTPGRLLGPQSTEWFTAICSCLMITESPSSAAFFFFFYHKLHSNCSLMIHAWLNHQIWINVDFTES